MQNFECILSSFEEIYPIWHDKLWPGRISKIESKILLMLLNRTKGLRYAIPDHTNITWPEKP